MKLKTQNVNTSTQLASQYHSASNEPYAALDLGSNSFHLVIARDHAGVVQIIDRHREMVRLGEGLAEKGLLSETAIQRALTCLKRISQRLRTLSHHNVYAVGTNAIRVAKNREEFIRRAEEVLGHRINVISGREEARLIYSAVSHDIESRQDRRLVLDIGGGSTELIAGTNFTPKVYESLPIGCITMTERWFKDGGVSRKRLNRATSDSRREFEVVAQAYTQYGWDMVIGTSGTLRAVQNAIASFTSEGFNSDSLAALESKLIEMGHIKHIEESWCSQTRALSLPGGIAIARAAFDSLQLEQIEVSSGAMREGLLYELLDRAHHEDIRELSVQNLTQRYQLDQDHSSRVADTALGLFDQLHESLTEDDEDDRQVLRWAALLHEIGMHISHIAYHKHGSYLIENMDLAGFSLTEQTTIAGLVLNHRRSLKSISGKSEDPTFLLLCLVLRLAVLLRRSRTNELLPRLRITRSKSKINLSIPEIWLERHPLTLLDLEEEVSRFKDQPLQLEVSQRSPTGSLNNQIQASKIPSE